MTNIKTSGMWASDLPEIHKYPCKQSLRHLFELRTKTYIGFAEIESQKGLLQPKMSLASSQGQEAVRILVQRGLEELAEALDSHNRDHYLEELIDAINYFWVLAIIDERSPLDSIIGVMESTLLDHVHEPNGTRITAQEIGTVVIELNPIFEKLRHRAWMHHPQSQYFEGWIEIAYFLGNNLCLIWDQFQDWQELVRYFIAKDNVLQFRIKSKY